MTNNNVQISVVIPVHNTGIYLEEALKSIFAQSFRQFELICVDDASDDNLTKEILGKFQKSHRNMQVLRQGKNVGAAEARNIGFSKVKGEYCIFLDADDIFAADLLEEMYQCISENQADVCVCGYQEFWTDNGKKVFGGKYIPEQYKISRVEREEWLLWQSIIPWNKLCRTQFLKNSEIYFQSLSSCNDVFFSCMVLLNASSRCFLDKREFIYYRTKTSIQISSNRDPCNLYKAVMLLNTVGTNKHDKKLLLQWSSALLLWSGIWELKQSNNEILNQKFYRLLSDYFKNHTLVFQNKVLIKCVENIKSLPYESNWFDKIQTNLGQLMFMKDDLKRVLGQDKKINLWGMGERGKAFQQFCMETGVDLQGVADIKNCNIGKLTDFGYKIINTEEILASDGLVVASNNKIYKYLGKINGNLKLLDLEEFCPM